MLMFRIGIGEGWAPIVYATATKTSSLKILPHMFLGSKHCTAMLFSAVLYEG